MMPVSRTAVRLIVVTIPVLFGFVFLDGQTRRLKTQTMRLKDRHGGLMTGCTWQDEVIGEYPQDLVVIVIGWAF